MKRDLWALIHVGCGGVAFYVYGAKPERDRDVPDLVDHRLINGRIPTPGGKMHCGTCKAPIGYQDVPPEQARAASWSVLFRFWAIGRALGYGALAP